MRRLQLRRVQLPAIRREHVLGIAALAAGVLVLTGGYVYIRSQPPVPEYEEGPIPEVVSESPALTDTERLRASYEPWEGSVVEGSTELPANREGIVWINSNGTLDASRWTVAVNPQSDDWKEAVSPEIVALTVNGDKATFRTNTNREYTVYVGQPFLLEWKPETVYAIINDPSPRLVTTSQDTVLRNRHLMEV